MRNWRYLTEKAKRCIRKANGSKTRKMSVCKAWKSYSCTEWMQIGRKELKPTRRIFALRGSLECSGSQISWYTWLSTIVSRWARSVCTSITWLGRLYSSSTWCKSMRELRSTSHSILSRLWNTKCWLSIRDIRPSKELKKDSNRPKPQWEGRPRKKTMKLNWRYLRMWKCS